MFLRDRLVCFADFVGMNLLALPFLVPLSKCSLRVFVRTPFAAVLNLFLPLTTYAISGAANSMKSATTRFAAVTINLSKKRNAVFPKTCANAPIPRPRC